MRLPFFSRRPEGPIRLRLPEMLQFGFGVYFSVGSASPPDPEALKPIILNWIDAHADEPIRSPLRAYVERGLLMVHVGARDLLPPPPTPLLEAIGLGEAEARRFQQATHLAIVQSSDLNVHPRIGFWAAVAGARAVARAMNGVILDPEIPRIESLDALDRPLPANAVIDTRQETIVPASVDRRGLLWLTTKGMCKFGLPELEVCDAPADLQRGLGPLLNALTQHLLARVARQAIEQNSPVQELILPEELRIGIDDFARDLGEKPGEAPEGVQSWAYVRLEYRPGKRGASDFLRLVPPRSYRGEHGVWLHGLLTDLFPTERQVSMIEGDDEEMEIAHRRAVEELPRVRQVFQAGLVPGQILYVKHGFPRPEGSSEWMWLVVNRWDGDRITGQLANDPQFRLDLRAGQRIELKSTDVYDWLLAGPDGRQEGGYTTEVLVRRNGG